MVHKIVDTIENAIVVVTSAIMLTLTFCNVISRYFLHASLSFTDEIVTGLFVIASLAGASIAIRKSAHVGLDFVTSFMPKKGQQICFIFACILGVGFCTLLCKLGVDMVIQEIQMKQITETMKWPAWIFGSTVPVGAGLLTVRYLLTLVDAIKELFKKGDVE